MQAHRLVRTHIHTYKRQYIHTYVWITLAVHILICLVIYNTNISLHKGLLRPRASISLHIQNKSTSTCTEFHCFVWYSDFFPQGWNPGAAPRLSPFQEITGRILNRRAVSSELLVSSNVTKMMKLVLTGVFSSSWGRILLKLSLKSWKHPWKLEHLPLEVGTSSRDETPTRLKNTAGRRAGRGGEGDSLVLRKFSLIEALHARISITL